MERPMACRKICENEVKKKGKVLEIGGKLVKMQGKRFNNQGKCWLQEKVEKLRKATKNE